MSHHIPKPLLFTHGSNFSFLVVIAVVTCGIYIYKHMLLYANLRYSIPLYFTLSLRYSLLRYSTHGVYF
jgi:hypothetical protein